MRHLISIVIASLCLAAATRAEAAGVTSLTTAQIASLCTNIKAAADSAVVNARAAGDSQSIANAYNATSSPAVAIWRPSISIYELNTAIVWSEFAGLSVGSQNAYFAMVQGGSVDATNANIRGGFSTIFSGKTSLTNLTNLAQRTATRLEALFSAGGPPAVSSVFGYQLSAGDVAAAIFTDQGTIKPSC